MQRYPLSVGHETSAIKRLIRAILDHRIASSVLLAWDLLCGSRFNCLADAQGAADTTLGGFI